jgi:hypothetical protein
MRSPKNTVEAVEKVLGEPAFSELPENAWKVRTNLILAAVISIAVVFGDLHIEPDSQILGLKFKGLTDRVLTNGLIAVVAYLFVHFLWASMDSLLEWRLRITGTRVAFVTTARLASEHGDYPNDPRQSSLYNWWKDEARRIGNLTRHFPEIDAKIVEWETKLRAQFTDGPDAMNIVNATANLSGVREQIAKLGREVKEASESIDSARIPASLERFDNWYALFLRSQNLRWLVIDFLAPVLAGGYALVLLLSR